MTEEPLRRTITPDQEAYIEREEMAESQEHEVIGWSTKTDPEYKVISAWKWLLDKLKS